MTKATFLWPYTPTLADFVYSSGQAEFAALHFLASGPALLAPGPAAYTGGFRAGSGGQVVWTHDDIFAAGIMDVNELLCLTPYNATGTVFPMCRAPTSGYGGLTPNGTAYVSSTATTVLARVRASFNDYTIGTFDLAAAGRDVFPRMVRLRVSGTSPATIQIKAWPAADAEPDDWDLEVTDTRLNVTGFPALGRFGTSSAAVFSHHSFGSGTDRAPALFGTISGSVQIAPNTGVARTVRAVAREDAQLVFEATSAVDGTYAIRVLKGFTYSVFALDTDGGTYLSPIKDKITPI